MEGRQWTLRHSCSTESDRRHCVSPVPKYRPVQVCQLPHEEVEEEALANPCTKLRMMSLAPCSLFTDVYPKLCEQRFYCRPNFR